jgi:hypothetical protein
MLCFAMLIPQRKLCALYKALLSLAKTWCAFFQSSEPSWNNADINQQIAYAKTKSDTVAKLDGTYKMPEPEREDEPEQASAQPAGFGTAPEKAVPVNAQDAAKGQKRGRAEMEMDVSDDSD